MIRFYGGGLIALVFLGFWLWALLDVISTDRSRTRNLPKLAWLALVVLFGAIGALAWLLLGRPVGATFAPGGATLRRGEGEPAWMQEDERRRRYAELDEELDRRIEQRRRDEREEERRRREQGLDGDASEEPGP